MRNSEANLSFVPSLMIGSIAGASEALINHPLWVLKMRSQSGQHFTSLYRGISANMSTMIFLTSIRLSASTVIMKKMEEEKVDLLSSEHKRILSSFIGGGISSLIGSPMEFARFRQLNGQSGFIRSIKNIVAEGGYRMLGTGLASTAIRDSIYTIGFFSLAPIFKNYLKQYEEHKLKLLIFSGAVAGIISGIVSQPFDMIKVYQQIHVKNRISLRSSISSIYRKDKLNGFFKGSFWRIARVTSGVTIISSINDLSNNYLKNKF